MPFTHLTLAVSVLIAAITAANAQTQSATDPPAQEDALSAPLPKLSELQNTTEIKDFEPPVEIVTATEFWDGGTTYVVLRDAKKRYAILCVSQNAFESTVPGNTLFLNAHHPDSPTTRLPFSEEEARLVIASLDGAVKANLTEEELEELQGLGDPAEHRMREVASVPENERWSTAEWNLAYAFDALRRLQAKPSYDVVSADGATKPAWHAAWAAEIAKKRAEEERKRKADELFESFYPEAARACFHSPTVDASMVAASQKYGRYKHEEDPDDPEQIQGQRLAEIVGDPRQLAVMSCKALATLTNDWTMTDSKTRIAVAAAHTIDGDAFLAALQELEKDPAAVLGAARLFFYDEFADKLPEAARFAWTPKLGEAVMTSGLDDEKHPVLLKLASSPSPDAVELLRRVARGETGKAIVKDHRFYEDPSIRATACLLLAAQSDASIRPVVESELPSSAASDKAAYELCLAFLGEPRSLREEHFQVESTILSGAAVQIIEKNPTPEGLELLFTVAFESRAGDEAVLAAQRITGQTWVKHENRHEVYYAEYAQEWWADHKAEFLATLGNVNP
jgi:hypothetical protein